jgi:hypothetical protein
MLYADLKLLGDLIDICLKNVKYMSLVSSDSDVGSGVKTRKRRLLRKSGAMSFKQRPKYRRFKNPIFLSPK